MTLTKNSGRRQLFFVDAIFTYLRYIFFLNKYLRSKCGQSFTNLAQQMNVLYSAEKKGRPLGSQALISCHIALSPCAGCCRAAAPPSGTCPPPPRSASSSRSDSDYRSSRAWGRVQGVATVVHMCIGNYVQCIRVQYLCTVYVYSTCVQYICVHVNSTCAYMCTVCVCTSVQYLFVHVYSTCIYICVHLYSTCVYMCTVPECTLYMCTVPVHYSICTVWYQYSTVPVCVQYLCVHV